MLTEHNLFDEPHYLSLELLASQALMSGDAFTAFKFADRRCRIPPSPKSYCYLLRSQALFQMGNKAAAVADLSRAKYLAPDDIAANRRILAWTKGSAQREAALALIRRDRNLDVLRKSIETLQVGGRPQIANAIVYDDFIAGWAVWRTDAALEIMVADGTNKLISFVDRDPLHSFSDLGNAANFEIRRPRSSAPQSITLSVGGVVIYSARTPGNESQPDDKLRHAPTNRTARDTPHVTVIVPVFADFESTRVCIESLLAQDHFDLRIILVNDATPYPRIAKYLAKCAKDRSVLLLENATNLGYIGSVNRALEHAEADDVLLLNSDTIGPRNFIERLRAAAASEPDIGTVTPLSNNGEYMSFPAPNRPNPPASPDDLSELDAVAAKVNAGRLVDIPNGIGFCLYITRACFDAVGPLSEDYVRGYLEDADFCLRARARGFRSVCAPSIYVGHVGTRSFGADKRALVMRNLDVIERRFPSYPYQSAAFVLADPLAPSRQAIERAIPPRATGVRLLFTGAGDISVVARERARRLRLDNQVAIILEFHNDGGSRVKMFNPAGGVPQSLEYALSSRAECQAMIDYIGAMNPEALEILDPASVPLTIMNRVLKLDFPHDIFVADDAFLSIHSSSLAAAGSLQPTRSTAFNEEKRLSRRWLDIARTAEHVIVPSEQAYACARKSFPASKLTPGRPFIDARRKRSRQRAQPASSLGILSVRGSGKEHALIEAVVRALSVSALEVTITVIGSTLDDIALMQNGRTFVTGAVDPEDFRGVTKSYGLQALFMPLTRPLFGHPLCEVGFTASLPVAFFDWSSGRLKTRENDLALDPLISFDNLIARLSRWLSQPYDA